MVRSKRRSSYARKSRSGISKKHFIFLFFVLLLMITVVVLLFTFKSKISQISKPVDLDELIEQDKEIYPASYQQDKPSFDSVEKDAIDYQKQDKDYLDNLIKKQH